MLRSTLDAAAKSKVKFKEHSQSSFSGLVDEKIEKSDNLLVNILWKQNPRWPTEYQEIYVSLKCGKV